MEFKKIWHNEPYLASNIGGIIKNEITGKVLSQRAKAPTKEAYNKGHTYLYVKLCPQKRPKKEYLVHRLIAIAWKKNTNHNKLQVNHVDGNRHNNDAANLQWVTASKNQFHKHKLIREKIKIEYWQSVKAPF